MHTATDMYVLSESEGILIATVSKRLPFREFKEAVVSFKNEASKKNMHRMLLDLTAVDYSDITIIERHEMGLAAVELLKPGDKIACLAQEQFINKHGENVAYNRGTSVLVTADRQEAINWLLK